MRRMIRRWLGIDADLAEYRQIEKESIHASDEKIRQRLVEAVNQMQAMHGNPQDALRDQFMSSALNGYIVRGHEMIHAVEMAVQAADAMLRERAK